MQHAWNKTLIKLTNVQYISYFEIQQRRNNLQQQPNITKIIEGKDREWWAEVYLESLYLGIPQS